MNKSKFVRVKQVYGNDNILKVDVMSPRTLMSWIRVCIKKTNVVNVCFNLLKNGASLYFLLAFLKQLNVALPKGC
jgi:hypothetical protein